MTEIKKYLGIDFGKSKIGLAIADYETRIAFAFDMLKNNKDLLERLKKICERENVKKIIIGKTFYKMDPKSSEEKDKFSEMIENEIGISIELQDEMFTTKIAQSNLKAQGLKKLDQIDDQESARIILQSWLDKNKS